MLKEKEMKEMNLELANSNPHSLEIKLNLCLDLSLFEGGCGYRGNLLDEIRKSISGEASDRAGSLPKLKPYHINNVELKQLCQTTEFGEDDIVDRDYPTEIDLLCGYSLHDEGVCVIELFAEIYNWDDPELEDFNVPVKAAYSKISGDLFVYFKNDKVDLNYHEFIRIDVTICSACDLQLYDDIDPISYYHDVVDDIISSEPDDI